MNVASNRPAILAALAALAVAAPASVVAQQATTVNEDGLIVYGNAPESLEGLPEGPEIEGFISARKGDRMQVTGETGTKTALAISPATTVKGSGGFLGGSKKMTTADLLNGLPVSVKTVQWNGGLVASAVKFKKGDFKTAAMIQRGTAQGFAEQTAATEALRSRVADIDNYNVKGVTNVYFDTGKYNLSGQSQAELCAAANQAQGMDNALLLVVGYTDSTGDYEFNQELSEKRATRVVNYLQQACGWKPYRMLTPTGMAEADPAADNTTEAGKAQNRRVAVNILVSKAVDGI
ncbi:Outer membrane protein Omp38 precursor [Tsuneonella dongtanensis]|uniref:Outer membrane protein Omp38 n=1 Tax=Tsuneonella dongtanensis TaxID=692370 RepID=A0A1B2AA00_9SPHN|nr:OmpA family protein [Tsuneonella dongtanensis]ANY18885.1 Outer membrane protein Omp38 precursor [Tsuneonella dongtanensis]